MRLLIIAIFALIPVKATAQCQSPQPGPNWVCVSDGWLPPGHPGIPAVATPQPPAPNLPPPAVENHNGWVYAGEAFKLLFDHDGMAIEGFYLEMNGQTYADISVTALLDRQITVNFAQGLPAGQYVFEVLTYVAGGTVTAKSDPYTLEVRPPTGNGKATHVRIIR